MKAWLMTLGAVAAFALPGGFVALVLWQVGKYALEERKRRKAHG